MSEIAVIDIEGFLAGKDLVSAPKAVEEAASTIGFFEVVGHGVARQPIDDAYEAMAALSGLSPEAKAAFLSEGHPYRGFHMNRDEHGVVRQERFLVSRFDDAASAIAAGVHPERADFFYANIWPDLAGFRQAISGLFALTNGLAEKMMPLCAVALGLPQGFFDEMLAPNASTFAVNHYPAGGEPSTPTDPRVLFAEHSDGNTLTILHQRGTYEGLEVKPLDADGEWVRIPVVDDAFVINVGELMTRWTNDHWPATRHRVVASESSTDSRTTLTTFHLPALDAVVAPLEVCGGLEDPHYEPVTPYEWERQFMARNYRRQALEPGPKVREFLEALQV
jgi:isopenicillin N synthase-like dioxygenase